MQKKKRLATAFLSNLFRCCVLFLLSAYKNLTCKASTAAARSHRQTSTNESLEKITRKERRQSGSVFPFLLSLLFFCFVLSHTHSLRQLLSGRNGFLRSSRGLRCIDMKNQNGSCNADLLIYVWMTDVLSSCFVVEFFCFMIKIQGFYLVALKTLIYNPILIL